MEAVIGYAFLGEVVGADLLRPVARADLSATLPGARCFLLRQHPVEQPRAQHLQGLDLVLQLALLILALHHQAARQVRDAHRTVGRVDTLTTRPARAEHVDPQVLLLDLDVHLLRLWEHCDRGGRRVPPALRLGFRYALHAVYAGLVSQRAVRLGPAHGEGRRLHTP